jgi:hypothetical protein
MAERLPHNLAVLYETFGREAIDSIIPEGHLEVDGVEFICGYRPESTPDRFYIVKPMAFVERFMDLCRDFEGAAVFELGIAEGGSTALMALVAHPRKLVSVDLEEQPLAALAEFINRRGLGDTVRPYYGVDQSDRSRLAEIAQAEFGAEPLDLVVDDASHQLAPTRSSFETLFPRLRAGGLFVIEDWNADHHFRDAVAASLRSRTSTPGPDAQQSSVPPMRPELAQQQSLSRLAVELLLARACTGDAVDEVTFRDEWIVVRRGPATLDPASFRLTDLYTDYFGYLSRN